MSQFSSLLDAPLPFPIKVVPSATGPVRRARKRKRA